MKKFFSKLKSLLWGDEKLKGGSVIFVVLVALSTVALITANILAGVSFSVFGWEIGGAQLVLTCGVLTFPITYILSDTFSEVYGFSASRRVTWLGFALNIFLIGFIMLGAIIPPANEHYMDVSNGLISGFGFDFLSRNDSVRTNFGLGAAGILVASLIAFVVGSWIDDLVFEGIKKLTKKKDETKGTKDNGFKFGLRAIGSSFAGEVIDSLIFIPLLYLFTSQFGTTITSFGQLMAIVLIQVTIKTLYEVVISPFTYWLTKKLKAYEAKNKEVAE